MKKISLLASIIMVYTMNLFAQTTSPLPYCYAGFDFPLGTSSDWINSVQLGTLHNVTNEDSPPPNYTFYNNLPAPNLVKNTSYTLNLNFGVFGGVGYTAWIDFNQDHIFDSTEVIAGTHGAGTLPPGASIPASTIITIPATALSGNTRMRVRITEDDTYHGAHPGAYELACDSMDSGTDVFGGETEDYTVNIVSDATLVNDLTTEAAVLVLYPNPATDYINIDDTAGESGYKIYNMLGKIVSEGISNNGRIDVRFLSSGTYVAKLHTLDGYFMSKIIISRSN